MTKIIEGSDDSTEVHTSSADLVKRLQSAPHSALDSKERQSWLAAEAKKAPAPREE